ncbi:MAG: nucleoside triphosphate pyrophosphatase [Polyangia bacterium]|jgi:septum formation protein
MKPHPDLILASASPRRRELLELLGLVLRIEPVDVDETPAPGEKARAYAQRLAAEKGEAALTRLGQETLPVLTADTVVVVGDDILGKPANQDEAAAMLRRLAGRRHEVMTAYRARFGGRMVERLVSTGVSFRSLDPAELRAYLDCGEWQGKAGAYAIQGIAGAFAIEVHGSFSNVVGLPLAEVIADLRALEALPGYPPSAFGGSAR